MPLAVLTFTVTGHGPFPLDMLRYDSAWPVDTIDAHKIADTFNPDRPQSERAGFWEIRLYTADRHAPTVARWASFNVGAKES